MKISDKQKQMYYSGVVGDGGLRPIYGSISYSSIEREYMEYKREVLNTLNPHEIVTRVNLGYKSNLIHSFVVPSNEFGKRLTLCTDEEIINNLDDYGITIWFLDDGSLHKSNYFYNLCTHSYSEEFQRDVIIPKLNSHGIYPRLFNEVKSDGRKFYYLYICKYSGALDISEHIKELGLNCYKYKTIPDYYYNNLSMLRKEFRGLKVNRRTLTKILKSKDEEQYDKWVDKANTSHKGYLVFNKYSKKPMGKDESFYKL